VPEVVTHEPLLDRIEAIVAMRRHGGKVTPIRRLRWKLDCSCGAQLGVALDWIDTKRKWREHSA
jgi:hypothetical protein